MNGGSDEGHTDVQVGLNGLTQCQLFTPSIYHNTGQQNESVWVEKGMWCLVYNQNKVTLVYISYITMYIALSYTGVFNG